MEELYGARDKASICLPLGTQIPDLPSHAERTTEQRAAKQTVGLPQDRVIALFTGSAHAPNKEAAKFLIKSANKLTGDGLSILIAGSVCKKQRYANVNATGPLPSLGTCFQAADIAINPMMSGSGMNLKLIQYLSFGLPVLSTDFGARGFEATQEHGIVLAALEDFMASLSQLARDEEQRTRLGKNARRYAEKSFAWDAIVATRLRAMEALLVP